MLEDVKESIIDRIGELVPEASPSTLKVLATTLDITAKIGKESADEKYLAGMLEIFNKMREQSEAFNRNLSSHEGLSLADISKIIGGHDDSVQNAG